ncbi:MAG TPA: nitroreductase family protein [Lacibacter sp.]|nr:nitroreductase family protein [Lacibacter sp.]HMO90521.1 nitroreductase family protein [Lacibacter sp.]HMP86742.1 nitroreductase family protein [Lacibacter sp.]
MLPHFTRILEAAALAPSGHNTQPWKFTVEGHYIRLAPDFSRRLPVVDADNHALYISLGCALENLVLAAAGYGYGANVMYDRKPGETAVVIHLYEDNDVLKDPLFDSIAQRHVNRSEYSSEVLPYELLHLLQKAVNEEEVELVFVTDEERRQKLAKLTAVACRLQFRNPAFRDELLQWVRFNSKTAKATGDGIFSGSIGSPAVAPAVGRFFFRHFVTPGSEAVKAAELAEQAPALLVLATRQHNPEGWIRLGRNFERLALSATRYNLSHSHLNMACEEAPVRHRLRETLQLAGEPLLLLRLGFAKAELPPSLRRPVEDMLVKGTLV